METIVGDDPSQLVVSASQVADAAYLISMRYESIVRPPVEGAAQVILMPPVVVSIEVVGVET